MTNRETTIDKLVKLTKGGDHSVAVSYIIALKEMLDSGEIVDITRQYFLDNQFKKGQVLTEQQRQDYIKYLTEKVDKRAETTYNGDKPTKKGSEGGKWTFGRS